MSIISALIGVDLGRRLKKLGEKWGGGASTLKGVSYTNSLSLRRLAHLRVAESTLSQGGRLAGSPGGP